MAPAIALVKAGRRGHRALAVMSFDEVASFSNLLESGVKCCRGGRWKPSVQTFEMTILRNTARNIENDLLKGHINLKGLMIFCYVKEVNGESLKPIT